MRKKPIYGLCLLLLTGMILIAARVTAQSVPSALQLSQIKRGYGMFIHFGLNTFNEKEWSDGKLPVSSYNPDHLDCDQWVKTAKEAGFRYVILVTKHHDGFALWNSKYTNYNVASSPVKVDVVAEVAKACKKYNLKLGLYYSLWDRHEPSYKDPDPNAYIKFMKNQLTELLTNYGEICELWFDGGWDRKAADWKIPEIYAYIKKLQPDCLVTVNHTIGKTGKPSAIQQPVDMQEGDPIRFWPVDFRCKDPNLARWDDPKIYTYNDKAHYLIFEHTLCLSDRGNWFEKKAMVPIRGVDELEELFYWTTAHNNIMIIDVPPDLHGQIRTYERLRLVELADRLKIRGGKAALPGGYDNLAFNVPIKASNTSNDKNHSAEKANDYSLETWWTAGDTTSSLEMDLQTLKKINRITLMEHPDIIDLKDGFSRIRKFHIKQFSIEYFNGKWDTIYIGDEIGACKIINLPDHVKASKIRLNILSSDSIPSIFHFSVADKASKVNRKISYN
jgi:alpha-L-fucosidase